MKILLINPPSETPSKDSFSYPLGLLYIAGVLEKQKHEVFVKNYFNESWEKSKNKIIELIEKYSPDILGVSCWTMNRSSCFKIVKISKKMHPECKIMIGGVHASSLYSQVLENFPVDFVVLGEAEETTTELIKALEKKSPKKSLKKIKGIAFKENKKIYFTGYRAPILNLDELPFPKHEFCRETIIKNKTATMITSRGCPFGCIFCSTSAYWGRRWRARSAKNVVDEVEHIIKKFPYAENIFFEDDEFTLNSQRVIEICKEMIQRKIMIKWQCSSRVDTVSEEMLRIMKQAGCTEISFGLESGSRKILSNIGKKITIEQIENAIMLTNKVGIKFHAFLMVGNPGETWETVKETAEFIKRLKNINFKSVGKLQIYPNTKIYELAKEQGIIDDSYWLSDKLVPIYNHEHSTDELTGMAYYIVAQNQLQRGVLNFIAFCIRFFFEKPKKAFRYALIKSRITR